MLLLCPGSVLSVPFVQTVTVLPCECSTETQPRQFCPHRHSPAPPGTSGLSLDQHHQPASPVTSKFVPNIENQSWLDLKSFCFQQHAVAHRRAWTGEAQKATEKRNIPERTKAGALLQTLPCSSFLFQGSTTLDAACGGVLFQFPVCAVPVSTSSS